VNIKMQVELMKKGGKVDKKGKKMVNPKKPFIQKQQQRIIVNVTKRMANPVNRKQPVQPFATQTPMFYHRGNQMVNSEPYQWAQKRVNELPVPGKPIQANLNPEPYSSLSVSSHAPPLQEQRLVAVNSEPLSRLVRELKVSEPLDYSRTTSYEPLDDIRHSFLRRDVGDELHLDATSSLSLPRQDLTEGIKLQIPLSSYGSDLGTRPVRHEMPTFDFGTYDEEGQPIMFNEYPNQPIPIPTGTYANPVGRRLKKQEAEYLDIPEYKSVKDVENTLVLDDRYLAQPRRVDVSLVSEDEKEDVPKGYRKGGKINYNDVLLNSFRKKLMK